MAGMRVRFKRLQVATSDLSAGMFIAQLDRPWLETPFLFQGFQITEESEIDQLRHYCQHVYVDITRSNISGKKIERLMRGDPDQPSLALNGHVRKLDAPPPRPATRILRVMSRFDPTGRLSERLAGKQYRNRVPTRKEAPKAVKAYDAAVSAMNDVLDQVREGRGIDVVNVRESVSPMIDSVLRNPGAMVWFAFLKKRDEYTYNHSIASSVWAVILGRHLGFEREDLDKLALGGMLLDIGKARVPQEILQKPGPLNAEELKFMRRHVSYSLDLCKTTEGIGREVLDMIESHHERHDGSGYPNGLSGADIPVYGRISGLVDCYDAMTTNRPYAKGKSSYDAIRELNGLAGKTFQKELVEQFVQALGMFPTGSLVELNTGEVGIVIEQNRVRRLRPKIMMLLGAEHEPLRKPRTIDLRKLSSDEREADARWIVQGHEPGAFGIDPKDYFM